MQTLKQIGIGTVTFLGLFLVVSYYVFFSTASCTISYTDANGSQICEPLAYFFPPDLRWIPLVLIALFALVCGFQAYRNDF